MIDITNHRFGRLVAIKYVDTVSTNARWLCRCDCGKERVIYTNSLRRGLTQSCGCLYAYTHTKHGESVAKNRTKEYSVWAGMMDRCEWGGNKPAWELYVARGIRVCKRWHDFRNFLADMGRVPKGKTLDRYPNNDGNYELGNCRWATISEQNLNRRVTCKVKYNGEIIPAKTLSTQLGLSHNAIMSRATRRNNSYVAAFLSVGVMVESV